MNLHLLCKTKTKTVDYEFIAGQFNTESYDERHEEFNTPGLNMFNIRNVDDFQTAFLLVDEYSTMKDRKHVGLTINHASPTMSQT